MLNTTTPCPQRLHDQELTVGALAVCPRVSLGHW